MVKRASVPHIILPLWFDTYDYAQRAEYLGIGIYPNRRTAPHIRAKDFSEAISAVVGDSIGASRFGKRARELGCCCAKIEGREIATAKILDVMEEEIERRRDRKGMVSHRGRGA